MKINPVGHGNCDNLHATARGQGITFKLILFFDSGDAYIVKNTIRNDKVKVNYDQLYESLEKAIDEMDFVLKTPRKKMMKHNFKTTSNLLAYIKSQSCPTN